MQVYMKKTETHNEAVVAFVGDIRSNSLKRCNQRGEKAISYSTNKASNDCHDRPED